MNKGFTNIKDINMKILLDIDDKDLIKACLTNKYINSICNDDTFWRNRFFNKYGEEGSKVIKPSDSTWKQHYLQVLIDLIPDRLDFLNSFKLGNKSFVNSRYYSDKKYINPLPQWVKTNYYLLTFENKLDVEVENNGKVIAFEMENPKGISLSQIAEKLLKLYPLQDNTLLEFHIYAFPGKVNKTIYITPLSLDYINLYNNII
jgi:uncharacterized protein YuzE